MFFSNMFVHYHRRKAICINQEVYVYCTRCTRKYLWLLKIKILKTDAIRASCSLLARGIYWFDQGSKRTEFEAFSVFLMFL